MRYLFQMTLSFEAAYSTKDRIPQMINYKTRFNTLNQCENPSQNETSQLHPPALYFDRRVRTAVPLPSLMPCVSISSASSSGVTSPDLIRNQILRSRGMSKSMPNLHSSRAVHNCELGRAVLSNGSECGTAQDKHKSHARIQEFENLLKDL